MGSTTFSCNAYYFLRVGLQGLPTGRPTVVPIMSGGIFLRKYDHDDVSHYGNRESIIYFVPFRYKMMVEVKGVFRTIALFLT